MSAVGSKADIGCQPVWSDGRMALPRPRWHDANSLFPAGRWHIVQPSQVDFGLTEKSRGRPTAMDLVEKCPDNDTVIIGLTATSAVRTAWPLSPSPQLRWYSEYAHAPNGVLEVSRLFNAFR
jgi:hypothetical protein